MSMTQKSDPAVQVVDREKNAAACVCQKFVGISTEPFVVTSSCWWDQKCALQSNLCWTVGPAMGPAMGPTKHVFCVRMSCGFCDSFVSSWLQPTLPTFTTYVQVPKGKLFFFKNMFMAVSGNKHAQNCTSAIVSTETLSAHTHTFLTMEQALATPLMDPENPILFGGWQSWNGWCWWTWTFSSGWQEWIPCYVMLCNFFPLPEDLEGTPEGQAIATVKVRVLRNLHERYVGPLGGSIFKLMVDQLGYKGLQKSDWYYNSIPVYDIGNQLAG